MTAPAPLKTWIAPAAVATLLAAYRQATTAEPCGVLVGKAEGDVVRIRDAFALRNAHPTPDRGFLLSEEDLLLASKAAAASGAAIVGFWHGHLEGGPYPGRQDGQEFASFAEGPNGAWAKVLVVLGRGETGRAVVRAYVASRDGLREVPLRT